MLITGRNGGGSVSRGASCGSGGGCAAAFRAMGLTTVVGGGRDELLCAGFGSGGCTVCPAGIGMLNLGLLLIPTWCA